ncbi:MAG: hypothetical protein J0I53_10485 [Chryseobacterium sp.]|nr:hypothetical protein [Chryseobacterium sp.]
MEKLETLEALDTLKNELDFLELEDRLEMVQLAALEADEKRCNGRCDDTPKETTAS